ncbi:coiled-coil and C2 domain-containing 1-like [Brachionus plicatilis]|uniref:Coiled-coil and C2 domain-containing 1-like n=1 Tax=Brachionus plicatilis TaxID=10195 RepID=A0A3M7PZV4_BRAPC|nr:coiled-coil and C2 domain-containing 1-like [Brachionus plicatilis]
MDDLDLGDLSQIDMPGIIEIPISHDIPRTTLDSLMQVKNEFVQKLEEANAKNDTSKKRRYQRQLKQFEDAIKATKEGKVFNYSDLVVPPGFAQIPLQSDGRPILNASLPNRTSAVPNKPAPKIARNEEKYDNVNDEAGDDLLEQLSKEIDDDDDDLGGDHLDFEDDHLNRKLNSLMPNIKKMLPKDHVMDDDFEKKLAAFRPPDFDDIKPIRQNLNKDSINTDNVPQPQIKPALETKKSPSKKSNSSKELNILEERQRLFKEAALEAKKQGNINVALAYLRNAKGFDSMIVAAENGLPLDMKNIPVPPQLQDKVSPSKKNVQIKDEKMHQVILNDEPLTGDRTSIYQRLMNDLREQIKIATDNFKQYTQMGDVNNANKFNKIAKDSIKDLDALKTAFSRGEDVPLYHYEKRTYQTIDCNSDLTDNDLDLSIIRAVNLPLPKDFDEKHMTTYVKFEFPYPPESLQTDKTSKISGTLNPEFNQNFKIQIQRKQTKFCRLMNRKELKFEIYYKAGFLKGDKLLATSLVKLQQLENSATIHDAFDLLEGRRQIGGKLEVKIRIREPIAHKKVHELELRWLIIDKFKIDNKDTVLL